MTIEERISNQSNLGGEQKFLYISLPVQNLEIRINQTTKHVYVVEKLGTTDMKKTMCLDEICKRILIELEEERNWKDSDQNLYFDDRLETIEPLLGVTIFDTAQEWLDEKRSAFLEARNNLALEIITTPDHIKNSPDYPIMEIRDNKRRELINEILASDLDKNEEEGMSK